MAQLERAPIGCPTAYLKVASGKVAFFAKRYSRSTNKDFQAAAPSSPIRAERIAT